MRRSILLTDNGLDVDGGGIRQRFALREHNNSEDHVVHHLFLSLSLIVRGFRSS